MKLFVDTDSDTRLARRGIIVFQLKKLLKTLQSINNNLLIDLCSLL